MSGREMLQFISDLLGVIQEVNSHLLCPDRLLLDPGTSSGGLGLQLLLLPGRRPEYMGGVPQPDRVLCAVDRLPG